METLLLKDVTNSECEVENCAKLIQIYSWGIEYPLHPISELKTAQSVFGAYIGGILIGCGYIHNRASPDGKDNDCTWICGAVVHPMWRRKGIFNKIYRRQIIQLINQKNRILACTDNPIMHNFFLKNGWKTLRETMDESGGLCTVYELRAKSSLVDYKIEDSGASNLDLAA